MNGSAVKDLRKQIRNVVKEQLPELLRMELLKGIAEELRKDTATRLTMIESMVKTSLEKMDSRSAQIETYMINQIHNALYKNAEPITKVDPLAEPKQDELSL
jgi:hypothetical protein